MFHSETQFWLQILTIMLVGPWQSMNFILWTLHTKNENLKTDNYRWCGEIFHQLNLIRVAVAVSTNYKQIRIHSVIVNNQGLIGTKLLQKEDIPIIYRQTQSSLLNFLTCSFSSSSLDWNVVASISWPRSQSDTIFAQYSSSDCEQCE